MRYAHVYIYIYVTIYIYRYLNRQMDMHQGRCVYQLNRGACIGRKAMNFNILDLLLVPALNCKSPTLFNNRQRDFSKCR